MMKITVVKTDNEKFPWVLVEGTKEIGRFTPENEAMARHIAGLLESRDAAKEEGK